MIPVVRSAMAEVSISSIQALNEDGITVAEFGTPAVIINSGKCEVSTDCTRQHIAKRRGPIWHPGKAAMWRRILVALALIASVSAAVYYIWFDAAPISSLTQASSVSPPLRIGNRAYLLSSQSRIISDFDESPFTRVRYSEIFLDLWAFDAANAKPIYRRRLKTTNEGNILGFTVLGVHHQTIWVLLANELHAINCETGAIAATPERIAYLNPNLRGLIPNEQRYFSVSAEGLSIKAADARIWYLHPDTLIASTTPPNIEAKGIPTTYFAPQSTDAFQERELIIGSKWLGVLSPKEFIDLNGMSARYTQKLGKPTRRTLYAGDVSNETIRNFKPITADFLAPGLLAEHRPTGSGAVILQRNPDSVFLLHQDRLGQDRKLFLARVSGPEGKILWNTPLNLSILQSVMSDERSLLLFGRQYLPRDPKVNAVGDPYHSGHEVLISLNWSTGAIQTFDHSDIEHYPAATIPPLP